MSFILGGLFGLSLLFAYGALSSSSSNLIASTWLCGMMSFLLASVCLGQFVARLRKTVSFWSLNTSALQLGDARIATETDISRSGLVGNDLRNACYLGAAGKMVLSYSGDSHLITVAPNNAGKTESVVIPNALTLSRNLIVTDKAGEVASATFEHRRNYLGHTIIAINPWRLHAGSGLPVHRYNPLQRLIDLANKADPDILDEARGFADLLVPEDGDAGANRIFQDKGRELILWIMLHLAYEAADGLDNCTLPRLYQILSSSEAAIKSTFSRIAERQDRLGGEIARQGEAFLADYQRSSKTMGAYLNNAQAGLIIYSPAGHIGFNTMHSDFDPSILKCGRATVYIVAPPEQLTGSGGKWAGVVLYSLIRAIWSVRTKYPRVLILADEFQNLSQAPIPLISQVLTVGRSFGIQLWAFVQDLRSFERYKDNASLFQSQSAVAQYWNVRNLDDAEYLEKRAGERGIISKSLSEKDLSADLSHSLTTIPALRAHQIMQLPAFSQLLVHQSDPVIKADLVSYRAVEPMKGWTSQSLPALRQRFDLRTMFSRPDPAPDHAYRGEAA